VDIVAKIKQMLASQAEIKKARKQELGRLSLEKAFITVNPQRSITFANFRAGRLLNSHPAHMIGEDAEEVIKVFDRKGKRVSDFYFSAENPKREVYNAERLYLTGTKGNRIPVKIQAAPILNEEGLLLGTIVSFENMALTETSASEIGNISTKTDLFNEMFERVKEGNPTLESIIHVHTLPGGNNASLRALEKAERRTEALNFLNGETGYYKGDINAETHLKGIILNLLELYGKRTFEEIQLNLEAVRLPAFYVRCLGILAGELVTNALVHSKGKTLTVSFRQLDQQHDTYELLVKDDGNGFNPEEEMNSRSALGFELIRHITKLINAHVRVESTEEGTEVLISGQVG